LKESNYKEERKQGAFPNPNELEGKPEKEMETKKVLLISSMD
jgi:hypothetical protein